MSTVNEVKFSEAVGIDKLNEVYDVYETTTDEERAIVETKFNLIVLKFETELYELISKYKTLDPVLYADNGLVTIGFTVPDESRFAPANGLSVDYKLDHLGRVRSKEIDE